MRIPKNHRTEKPLFDGGYITFEGTTPKYHFYVQDHLGNNRLVMSQTGQVEQQAQYYPSGAIMTSISEGLSQQPYLYSGKELDRMHALDWYDFGARHYDAALLRWHTIDPLCEKYYHISPYAFCANNPINIKDPHGDTIVVKGDVRMFATSMYNAIPPDTKVSIRISNGRIDPASIPSSDDSFLTDLKEVAENSQIVEIYYGSKYYYKNNEGSEMSATFEEVRDVIDTPEEVSMLQRMGLPHGKTVSGNTGVSLFPKSLDSEQISTNQNIQIHINNSSHINHQAIGLAHELIHVNRYMHNLPYTHRSPAFNSYLYNRLEPLFKRLGYDYVDY